MLDPFCKTVNSLKTGPERSSQRRALGIFREDIEGKSAWIPWCWNLRLTNQLCFRKIFPFTWISGTCSYCSGRLHGTATQSPAVRRSGEDGETLKAPFISFNSFR